MRIIHFTHGATDPLKGFDAKGAHYVPLADGGGDVHVSCVHLDPGATIDAPSLTHAAALLVVHGRITLTSERGESLNIDISGGMGTIFEPQLAYTFRSGPGAILLIVEAQRLAPHIRGISTPQRIAGQTWPSDALLNGRRS